MLICSLLSNGDLDLGFGRLRLVRVTGVGSCRRFMCVFLLVFCKRCSETKIAASASHPFFYFFPKYPLPPRENYLCSIAFDFVLVDPRILGNVGTKLREDDSRAEGYRGRHVRGGSIRYRSIRSVYVRRIF